MTSKELMLEAFNINRTEIKQALKLTDQDELIEAEKIYLALLDQQQNFPPALHGLAELADKINDQQVREDLLRRAIEQISDSEDRSLKGLKAIWLSELAESLIKQGRQEDAREYISETEKLINTNLA